MIYFLVFVLGVITGIVLLLATFGIILNRRGKPKVEATVDRIVKDMKLMEDVKKRFSQIEKITDAQVTLISHLDRPSAGAAHSKHKNQLAHELKRLEIEKIDVMRSIVNDGVDPMLTVIVEGETKKLRMSEAIALHDTTVGPSLGAAPGTKTDTNIPSIPNKKIRLVVNNKETKDASDSPKIP